MTSGGKQYRVQPGDIVQIEKIEGDVGSKVQFKEILFCSKAGETSQIWIGKPLLGGAQVEGEIVGQGRGDKVMIVKMKRRKQYRRTQGHRQYQTQVLVTGVSNGTGEAASLSAADRTNKLKTFQSHLKAKGSAFSSKQILGKRALALRAAAAHAAGGSAEKAPAAKKKSAPRKKKTDA